MLKNKKRLQLSRTTVRSLTEVSEKALDNVGGASATTCPSAATCAAAHCNFFPTKVSCASMQKYQCNISDL